VSRRNRGRSRPDQPRQFQSRAGFSECLDGFHPRAIRGLHGFNPVLGFLSVSTDRSKTRLWPPLGFNPVLGFLSVSTNIKVLRGYLEDQFQSRAGFSECLDSALDDTMPSLRRGFNPVLGFLSVSTYWSKTRL